ncbi:hypothetical protein Gpo141_00000086 [Globisporangium polare]
MGKAKFTCEYCQKAFDDSQEARRRHFQGRNHKANVKLWYDSFADQEQRIAAATATTTRASGGAASAWTADPSHSNVGSHHLTVPGPSPPAFDLRSLPPSMLPPPPDAFYYKRADWG